MVYPGHVAYMEEMIKNTLVAKHGVKVGIVRLRTKATEFSFLVLYGAKRPFVRPRQRSVDNIKTGLR
jgi:hypothetical protein